MQERELHREVESDIDFVLLTEEELKGQAWFRRGAATREMLAKGKVLVKGKQIPWHLHPQGILRRYSEGWPIADTATDTVAPFHHLIPHHSGKHRHQGGFSIFVLEGTGYTVIDGVRYDWEAGDLLLLPLQPGGCEHQHFNTGDKPARWMAIPTNYSGDAVGGGGGQRENSPLWHKYYGASMGPWVDQTKKK